MKREIDSDLVLDHDCVGRPRGLTRLFRDAVCWLIGHNPWRVMNSTRLPPGGSLPLFASYCRRCYRGGYVQGDYYRG